MRSRHPVGGSLFRAPPFLFAMPCPKEKRRSPRLFANLAKSRTPGDSARLLQEHRVVATHEIVASNSLICLLPLVIICFLMPLAKFGCGQDGTTEVRMIRQFHWSALIANGLSYFCIRNALGAVDLRFGGADQPLDVVVSEFGKKTLHYSRRRLKAELIDGSEPVPVIAGLPSTLCEATMLKVVGQAGCMTGETIPCADGRKRSERRVRFSDLCVVIMPVPSESSAEAADEDVRPKPSPFERKFVTSESQGALRFKEEVADCLRCLNAPETSEYGRLVHEPQPLTEEQVERAASVFARRWKLKDGLSEVAFKGLLLILEHLLAYEVTNHASFAYFVETLGFHTVFFWKKTVPLLYDSDMQFGTNYRDGLLLSLTLYDVNAGRNRLRELFAAIPGLRASLLAKHAKRFEEAYHHMLIRRMNSSSLTGSQGASENSVLDFLADQSDNEEESTDREANRSAEGIAHLHALRSQTSVTDASLPAPDSVLSGGLSSGHFQERVITVSNAPPVSLRKKDTEWEIGQGSGGLVSCCEPVMNKDPGNVWLACFGPNVPLRTPSRCDTPLPPPTNSLGLPLIKKVDANIYLSMLQDPAKDEDAGVMKEIREQMSLLGVFRAYNKENYQLNPVVVAENDYNTYYGGISNGLLWPAFHNLPEYIVRDYADPRILQDHWCSYVRVNYQFAINAVRNSRPQDFLWIHDYHLLLTGLIIQSLDPNFEVGFFLHTPFQPPSEFFTDFKAIAVAVLRGMTRFTKVGFQTHRDRSTFVSLVGEHLSTARIEYVAKTDNYQVTHEGWTTSVGVFPVSIKNEEFLVLVSDPEVQSKAKEIRHAYLGSESEGKFFFSCERFDYTKGIKEKLLAYERFLEKHPERHGKDVLFQVAVTNRRAVESYREYQDCCIALADKINSRFNDPKKPEWKAVVLQTEGLPRRDVVAHYLAMDVGVVTPIKDGMNLVAKEMLICNPSASLILSSGAGTEQQFGSSGFYTDTRHCYHRVECISDKEEFADLFHEAADESRESIEANGKLLHEFLLANDIEKWSGSFLDPSWTHEVIQSVELKTLKDFYTLMFQTRTARRHIVERVVKGFPIRHHFALSLKNAKESLEAVCEPGSHVMPLRTGWDTEGTARLDVSDEIRQLELDLSFLEFVQSEEYDNLEQFLRYLAMCHPEGSESFFNEVDKATQLMYRGDHFQYFFTDRDGTLKSYACSYNSSVEPAYSAVIQATFANRCTQYAAILTSAPLLNPGILDMVVLPDGYFCYGASIGREWYIDATKKFKDKSISENEIALLEQVAADVQQQLQLPEFQMFNWIGSGLQKHYGHITVAHQDCYDSVDPQSSRKWIDRIKELVHHVDPDGKYLELYEGKTDVRVLLHSHLTGKVFTKGDGIRLFAQEMNLDLACGNVLVCGDSDTDLPMLREMLSINPENTFTIWVACSAAHCHHPACDSLKRQVKELCESYDNRNYVFVSSPSVLLGAMAQATIREIRIRPSVEGRRDSLDMYRTYPTDD
uniref:alpha,alpha-trehalose-phosphate synthase (UDP-forming) n=1 Tax=Trichuris muris TaxID=70415 RepID=A0A5S6QLH9_TRIMR